MLSNTFPTKNRLKIPFLTEASLDSTFKYMKKELFSYKKNVPIYFFNVVKRNLKKLYYVPPILISALIYYLI